MPSTRGEPSTLWPSAIVHVPVFCPLRGLTAADRLSSSDLIDHGLAGFGSSSDMAGVAGVWGALNSAGPGPLDLSPSASCCTAAYSSGSAVVALALRRRRRKRNTRMRMTAATRARPTPSPAFAPVDMPELVPCASSIPCAVGLGARGVEPLGPAGVKVWDSVGAGGEPGLEPAVRTVTARLPEDAQAGACR